MTENETGTSYGGKIEHKGPRDLRLHFSSLEKLRVLTRKKIVSMEG